MVALNQLRKGTEIDDPGYNQFIGREIFEDGHENFVTLNLHTGGSNSYRSLRQACNDLCRGVESGERISLYKSLGHVRPKTRSASPIFEALTSALGEIKREDADVMVFDQNQEKKTYTTVGREYKKFTTDQMILLQQMYLNKPEMQRFPNPFVAQPQTH